MSKLNIIWLSCKQATFLMSKKEEGKISFKERVQLRLHLSICDFCTRFQKQTAFFTKNAPHTHEHVDAKLSDEKKTEIKELMK